MHYAILMDGRHFPIHEPNVPACLRNDPFYVEGKIFRALYALCEASVPYTEADHNQAVAEAARRKDLSIKEAFKESQREGEVRLKKLLPDVFERYHQHFVQHHQHICQPGAVSSTN